MSDGELTYLVLAIGCFVVFAVSVAWLRADYVTHRRHSSSTSDRLQAWAAE